MYRKECDAMAMWKRINNNRKYFFLGCTHIFDIRYIRESTSTLETNRDSCKIPENISGKLRLYLTFMLTENRRGFMTIRRHDNMSRMSNKEPANVWKRQKCFDQCVYIETHIELEKSEHWAWAYYLFFFSIYLIPAGNVGIAITSFCYEIHRLLYWKWL